MTERERWIVYPLLFLALGASLRDKFSAHTTSKVIECQGLTSKVIECHELRIVDEDPTGREPGRLLAKFSGTESNDTEPARGLLVVDGEANIGGQLVVQGVPIVPVLQNLGQGLQTLFGGARQRPGPTQLPPRPGASVPDK